MGHPDFRVGGKIFATLHAPEKGTGAVMLLPEQQELAMEAEPEAFRPAAGAWGRGGSTVVSAGRCRDEWLERALEWAWAKRAPTRLTDSASRLKAADVSGREWRRVASRRCAPRHSRGSDDESPESAAQRLPSSAIVASTIGLVGLGVELVADQGLGGGGGGARRPWRGPRRARRARRRRSCPRPCGCGARPERRRRPRPWRRCRRPRRGRARAWSRPRRRPAAALASYSAFSASASARSCAASSSCSRMPAIFLSSAAPISGRHPLPDQDREAPRPSPARPRPAASRPSAVGSA